MKTVFRSLDLVSTSLAMSTTDYVCCCGRAVFVVDDARGQTTPRYSIVLIRVVVVVAVRFGPPSTIDDVGFQIVSEKGKSTYY